MRVRTCTDNLEWYVFFGREYTGGGEEVIIFENKVRCLQ